MLGARLSESAGVQGELTNRAPGGEVSRGLVGVAGPNDMKTHVMYSVESPLSYRGGGSEEQLES